MSQKFLNLDEIATEEKVTIKVDGANHELKEMSVGDFAWAQKQIQQLEKAGPDGDPTAVFDQLVDIVSRQFPTLGREGANKLTMSQLNALMKFIQDFSMNGAEESLEQAKERAADTEGK